MKLGVDPARTSAHPGQSALAAVALRLVGEGATASTLSRRFAEEGAVVDVARSQDLLNELGGLGLVRVARQREDGAVHVVTSLGRQLDDSEALLESQVASQLAELEHLRTDLLSTIAHELRTPLTAVRTCVGLLRDPDAHPTDEERTTLLATIERNADRMQQIVGDILQIARFRTGEIVLQLRQFDAASLAKGAVASLEPLATARGQTLTLHLPATPIRVFGDHRRLEQALVNLVSNAVKYGRVDGSIDISVHSAGGWATFAVRDDGPGIADDDRPHLFERFFVGPNDRVGAAHGVGLGLPTALAIAQAHGGRIDVESASGLGSTFTLVVPIDGPEELD